MNNIDLESARIRLNILSLDRAMLVVNGIVPQCIITLFQLHGVTVSNASLRSVSNNNFCIPRPETSLF